jgi:flagellar hook-associated protein 1 FlgK
MSLTVALNSARSSLMASGVQSSVISRNVAGLHQDGYSRKNALIVSQPGSGVYVSGIQRAASAGLFNNVVKAVSTSAQQDALYNGLQKVAAVTIDDPELDQSAAAQLAKLKSALQQYASAPNNVTFAQTAVTAAKGVRHGSERIDQYCTNDPG